jgi:lipoprotein-anchoring transpeptidase ErfK/SrfK
MKSMTCQSRVLPAIAALAMVLSSVAHAEAAAAQPLSVSDRLTARGMKFEVDKDGDYRVAYRYAKQNRTQLVYVGGTPEEVHGLTVRRIFAPAAIVARTPLDATKMQMMLEDAGGSKLGGWEVRGGVLYYAIKLPEPVAPDLLETAMDIAAESADDMELTLTGRDDL